MVYLSCGKNKLHTNPAAKILLFLHTCKIFVIFFKNNRSNGSEIRIFLFLFFKNNRSNGSEIRHKKCFFALFLFFVHLRQILSTFVSCSGRQAGASSFIVPDVIRLFSSFSDGYYPPLFYIFLAFYSISLAFYSIFLYFFFQNSCKFSLFPCTFHFFILLLHPQNDPDNCRTFVGKS